MGDGLWRQPGVLALDLGDGANRPFSQRFGRGGVADILEGFLEG